MNNLFICSTQYQIINIVNIIDGEYYNDNNYLFILECFNRLSIKIEKIAENAGCFKNIVVLKAGMTNSSLKSYMTTLIRCLNIKSFGSGLNLNIDSIFITNTEAYSRIIACYFLQKKNTIKLFFYEDGVESYTDILSNNKKRKLDTFLRFVYKTDLNSRCDGMYLYAPELLIENAKSVQLYKISPFNRNKKNPKALFKQLGTIQDNNIKNIKYLWLDAGYDDEYHIQKSNEILKVLDRVIGDDLYIKPHPRKFEFWKQSKYRILKTNISFEYLYMLNDMRNTVLISVFSTACITPKLLFNETPPVIFLYKLFPEFGYMDPFFQKFSKLYSNANGQFFMPDSLSDLDVALKKIKMEK